MDKDEIISKLGWFTQMKSIPPLTDKFKTEQIIFFENIIHFLQDNGLTTKEILKKGEKPTDNTEIKRFFVTFGAVHVLKLVNLLPNKVMLVLLNMCLLIALILFP